MNIEIIPKVTFMKCSIIHKMIKCVTPNHRLININLWPNRLTVYFNLFVCNGLFSHKIIYVFIIINVSIEYIHVHVQQSIHRLAV